MDFLYWRPMFLFLLPTPYIVGKPLEFLVADIKHVVSWSEAEGRLGSFPHQKKKLWEVEKFWSNSYDIVF